ncbi:2OG-Fe(II) oxygenase [Burkholderia pseudomallei]|uniref:alpha-ketoglutarate-dependent dioxygenase AlkB family protein n=1 Tax=Burkholderia pseudomallei TaxID=28450 RepID=UPI000F068B58|nr:alpha-ketoglutarate-dependent dioxygenase AlkB [Burkholderia pseudomallei]CAJ2724656.1 2OG-Fe(II) oxygenase [Burkholderia pseudomallei]CAJ2879981.1 2OG-Fe(II) oxygenase [Burkholderia pseudomallei]CAJ4179434.1 2OG-Fe(II) oxygenase [Burkholderia pseudomallei]CAJ4768347.1 2OG-Fe(II) oxygenase [Burkholderia pseudomallei]CAJ7996110.1 2OG-Fe(II) oxygenase [Burkholderia pseudomallei]
MDDLFDDLPRPDADWHPDWLAPADADRFHARLVDEVAWRQDTMRTPRGLLPLPRLTAWQGEPDALYVYSGIRNEPAPWTPAVLELKRRVEAASRARFNSVLLNRYRNGFDSMGWHADDEPELGAEPVIASLSLGATRVFDLRHNETGVTHAYRLTSGSLLVMRGRTQHAWRHRVPKEPAVRGERINLTFRWVSAPPAAERRARPRSRG